MSVVSKGYQKAQDKLKEMKKAELFSTLKELRWKEDENIRLRFIDDEPFEIRAHALQRFATSGKKYFINLTCALDADDASAFCYLCTDNKAKYNGIFRVLVRKEFKIIKDEKGKFIEEKVKDVKDGGTVMLIRAGVTQANLFFRFKEKMGAKFTECDVEIERTGTGVGTSYILDWKAKRPLSTKDKKLISTVKDEMVIEYLQPLSPIKIFEMFPHLAANVQSMQSVNPGASADGPSEDDIPF